MSRPPVDFTTDRLILRRWCAEDRVAFREMNAHPEVMRYFANPLTPEGSDTLVDRIEAEWDAKGWGLWAVEVKGGEGFIGFIGFHEAVFESDFTPAVEIGWRLARQVWGHGYATEGARRCLEEGFGRLGFDEIVSFAARQNIPSINVMKKLGLEPGKDFWYPEAPEGNPLGWQTFYHLSREAWMNNEERNI